MPVVPAAASSPAPAATSGIDLDRLCFVARKRIEHEIDVATAAAASTSRRCRPAPSSTRACSRRGQLQEFFTDLDDERLESALALVHSRFSTNTFPSWPLAHPYRYVAHNGEINTVQGNENWMRAREALLRIDRTCPATSSASSRSARRARPTRASFDEALELLHLGGRPLPHAVLMMIPEAWENHESMPDEKRAFYEFHASLMEPWDGPASIAFTDGTVIGAVLDRNGLRPSRYWVTDDDLVDHGVGGRRARRAGPTKVVQKGRLQPGACSWSTPRRAASSATTRSSASSPPSTRTASGSTPASSHLDDLPDAALPHAPARLGRARQQRMFGYTHRGAARSSSRPWPAPATSRSARWAPTRRSPCSRTRPRLLFDYFQQLFAQVTNPPLDAIREELVTSSASTIGPEGNLLDPTPASCRQIVAAAPDPHQRRAGQAPLHQRRRRPPGLHALRRRRPVPGRRGRRRACAGRSTRSGAKVVDGHRRRRQHHHPLRPPLERRAGADPVAAAHRAVHHHLIREKTRTQVGLVVETGEAREVHHMALLLGYGAGADQPVPRVRDDRGPDRRTGHARRASPSARRSATTSRRAARASSR